MSHLINIVFGIVLCMGIFGFFVLGEIRNQHNEDYFRECLRKHYK